VTKPIRAVFYRRVSTEEQGDSMAGLDAQAQTLQREAQHRGWTVVADFHDVASGKSTNGRHGLASARQMLDRHEAEVLATARLDRLSRSVVDFGRLLEDARRRRWKVVALDMDVDTTTATGEAMANLLITFAQWERRIIGERTRDAMAAKKRKGAKFGVPSPLPPETLRTIKRLRRQGFGSRRIVAYLNEHAVPTPNGEGVKWHLSQVQRVLNRHEIRDREGRD
jgi:DNA invertase Pin-like site-specific DNA recombinase